ncbi:MAG: DNA polymerase III subunit delta' [Nitrospirae bacterium]|nr:DNA polymerase III subunit delta' [Nitrospirota bacterium]
MSTERSFETSFETILGHAHPKAVLTAAIASGRIAHAYLFHGESHIGKFLTAVAFAKAALCSRLKTGQASGRPALSSCDQCSSCHAVDSGSHPDIHFIGPDGAQIKIGQIRELQDAIAFKPLVGSRKWFIMDEADAMNPEAANSFLKTLEEPPDHSTLILITARPQALLPTVLSRCQSVRFSPPPPDELSPWLQKQRGIGLKEALLLSTLAMGKIGIAAEADPDSLKEERDRVLDALSKNHLEDLAELFNEPEELASSQEQLYKTLDTIEIWLRDVLIGRHTPEPSLLINQDIPDRISAWGRAVSTDQLLEILTLIHLLKRASTRNLNHALVLETVLLKIRDAVVRETAPGPKPD